MNNYALYRLPYADTYTEIRSEREPRIIPSYEKIGMEEGFVIAPFRIDVNTTPIVLLLPDIVEEKPLVRAENIDIRNMDDEEKACFPNYEADFNKFHDAIVNGMFQKIVLSRAKEVDINTNDYHNLFFKACCRYPRLMIMLVSTEATGTWLVASPEILLTGDGSCWRTMALAGTMSFKEGLHEWSKKNQQEQRFVEAYIEDGLTDYSVAIIKDGPRTQRAGNLVHLCTDFRFRLAKDCGIGEVLASMHPTPAVCGIPKERAREFIMKNETTDRQYYSGFMGPVGINGSTHVYVSLRCAKLYDSKALMFAGGGIMLESELLSEWEETKQKMQTIGDVLK